MRSAATTATVNLESNDVECTYCGVRMASHVGSGGLVRYFHCPGCQRWSTSMYTEVFRADTKLRPRAPANGATSETRLRVQEWLKSLTVKTPWQVLGCAPADSDLVVRERYLALAREHHPDRGGNADEMRALNEAYAQILEVRERAKVVRHTVAGLPTRA
jgi:hypothetical protein